MRKNKAKTKNICLVYPNQTKLPSFFDKVTNIPKEPVLLLPLGLLYVASNSKYKIDIIDNRVAKLNDSDMFDKLRSYDVIGFGGTIFEARQAINLSKKLKKKGKITIYGGPNANVNWNLYLNDFDLIFRGEAEEYFDPVIENIESTSELNKLGFLKKKGTFVNKQIFRINDLDKLCFPDRDLINLGKYKREEISYMGNVYPVDTVASSRGCPFECTFCSSKYVWQRKYTIRSVKNIIKEIKLMKKKYGTKGIYFREDNFTISKKRVLEFCKAIRSINIAWMCESRVDTLDEETIKEMSRSNCRAIWFGIESTSNKTLKRIKKGFTIERAKETIKLCKTYGIKTGGGFMLGFPHETKENILSTIKESKKIGLDNIFYNRVWAIPKSEMHNYVIKNRLDTYKFENIVIPSTEYLSADEVTNIYYKYVGRKSWIKKIIRRIFGDSFIKNFRKHFPDLFTFLNKHI